MKGRKIERPPFLAFPLFVLAAGAAFAHQPRLVDDRPSIIVRDPEISQAFYARLAGNPQRYYIGGDTPLRLYVNLLVPDIPGIETDYEATVFRETDGKKELLARRDSGPPDLELLTLAQDRIVLLFVMGRVAPMLC